MGGGSKAVWNFSENSSVLEWGGFPYPLCKMELNSQNRVNIYCLNNNRVWVWCVEVCTSATYFTFLQNLCHPIPPCHPIAFFVYIGFLFYFAFFVNISGFFFYFAFFAFLVYISGFFFYSYLPNLCQPIPPVAINLLKIFNDLSQGKSIYHDLLNEAE